MAVVARLDRTIQYSRAWMMDRKTLQHWAAMPYADFSNSSRPISMRRISLVPAPIS
jgi:hypothetical protein